ncbi:MAG: phage tail tube protein [Peptostreptococcus anaerobius]
MAKNNNVTGVYPVYKIKFKVGTKGKASTGASDMAVIKDLETFSLSIDGNVEEWTPMDTDGWARRLMTGKAFSISLNGKRHVGDPGNDYVADVVWKDGLDCSTKAEIEFPNGAKLKFDCVIDVKSVEGADQLMLHHLTLSYYRFGKPELTPAPSIEPTWFVGLNNGDVNILVRPQLLRPCYVRDKER